MPYFEVQTSTRIPEEKRPALRHELARIIELIPGKSEGSLMVQFTDNCRLWFGGAQDGPIAMVNVMLYGSASDESCEKFSQAVIPLFQRELGASHVYLKFEEVPHWYWN